MILFATTAALRRWLIGITCVLLLLLAGCSTAAGGPATADATTAHATTAHATTGAASAGGITPGGYARRAAAQLQVKALPGAEGGQFEGHELELPLATPDFVLTDTSGRPFDFARDATRPVTLVYFGYSSCPDVCPAHMAAISKALSQLPAEQAGQVQVLFISVDTLNDKPDTLGAYLDNFDEDFVGLTGTADEINGALRSVGLPPTAISSADEFPPTHPSYVLAYTSDHRAHVVYPFGTPPSAYTSDIPQLISTDWGA